jgi:1-acyl-sn-glycerol-3-phosphate acyltransferase
VIRAKVHEPWLGPPCPILRLSGESWFALWGRRAISWSTLVILFLAGWLSAPLWLGGLWVWDTLKGARLGPRTRCGLLALLYLSCQLGGLLAAGVIWLLSGAGALGGHGRYRRANSALQEVWATLLFRGVSRILDLSLDVEADVELSGQPILVFVRHTSLLDTLLASVLIARPYRRRLRYVLKKELLWDPCLDLVGRRLLNVFVERGGEAPQRELEAIRRLADDLEPDEGVLIYPEGTRFSQAKLARAQQRWAQTGESALAREAMQYRRVLPPRLGGPIALLETGYDVLLLAHSGLEKAADLSGAWSGQLIGTTLRARLTSHQAPHDHRESWLFQLWAELDRWVVSSR